MRAVEQVVNESDKKIEGDEFASFSRSRFYLLFFSCSLFPFLVIAGYISTHLAIDLKREILTLSALSYFIGAGGAGYFLRIWEKKMKLSVISLVQAKVSQLKEIPDGRQEEIQTYQNELIKLRELQEEQRRGYEHQIDLLQSSVAKSKDQANEFNVLMDKKMEEMRNAYLEFEDLRKEYHRLEEEFALYYEESRERLKHKESILEDYQKTISEQRLILEKKQSYIARLEAKVRDLMFEIRSLLQLGDSVSSSGTMDVVFPTHAQLDAPTSFDLTLQLQKFIEKAEAFTGAEHLGYVGGKTPRFLDVSRESYTIDLRRLFDFFRDESSGIIFLYSLSEKKFLFVNNYVKTLLGWSPEKFIKDFYHLLQSDPSKWERFLFEKNEKKNQISVLLRNRSGEDITYNCIIQSISKGPFIGNIIGILTPIKYS